MIYLSFICILNDKNVLNIFFLVLVLSGYNIISVIRINPKRMISPVQLLVRFSKHNYFIL